MGSTLWYGSDVFGLGFLADRHGSYAPLSRPGEDAVVHLRVQCAEGCLIHMGGVSIRFDSFWWTALFGKLKESGTCVTDVEALV